VYSGDAKHHRPTASIALGIQTLDIGSPIWPREPQIGWIDPPAQGNIVRAYRLQCVHAHRSVSDQLVSLSDAKTIAEVVDWTVSLNIYYLDHQFMHWP